MNYYEIVKLIENTSLRHPMVNTFFTDQYALVGNADDIRYGVISLLSLTHNIGENISTYNFKMIYADRLTGDNELQIQSVAIDTLTEICNGLKVVYGMDLNTTYNVDIFTNQFADECAGGIIEFSVTTRSNIGACNWLNDDICVR